MSEFSLKYFHDLLLQPAINSRFWSNWSIELSQAFLTSAKTLITYPQGIQGLRFFFQIGGSIWHAVLMRVLQILHRTMSSLHQYHSTSIGGTTFFTYSNSLMYVSLFVTQKNGATKGWRIVSIDKQRVTVSYWCDITCSLVKFMIYRYWLKTETPHIK